MPLTSPDLPAFDDVSGAMRELLTHPALTGATAHVRRFEQAASEFLGTHVVAVSSATIGLLFTLQALGLKPGQRVILPSFTSVATAQAIRYAGGRLTFAEIGPDLTLAPLDLEMLLERHRDVAAVVPVHLNGVPCAVDAVQEIVSQAARRQERPISVVYDAAHAFGSSVHGRPVGGFGTAEVFSFSPATPLASFQGGLVASHSPGLIGRLRSMRNYGIETGNVAYWPGLNGRMCELDALIGLASLRRFPERLAARQQNARLYGERLATATPLGLLSGPVSAAWSFASFPVVVPPALAPDRDQLVALLAMKGVAARAQYVPPLHQQPCFRAFADRRLPVTEDLSRRVIALPFFTAMTEAQMDQVVEALCDAIAELTRLRHPALPRASAG